MSDDKTKENNEQNDPSRRKIIKNTGILAGGVEGSILGNQSVSNNNKNFGKSGNG